jgi:hypothetical protein
MPRPQAGACTSMAASPPDTDTPASHFRQGRTFPAVLPSQRAAARPLGPAMLRPAVVNTVTLRRFRS